MSAAIRYLCPVVDCDWRYDEAAPGLADLTGLAAAPDAVTLNEISASNAEQAGRRRAEETEVVLRGHLATHGIHTADELAALLAGA
jgi:hypothetical protein